MDHSASLNQVQTLIGRLSVHQDFFWFFSLLGWSLALVVWWRHPERRTTWIWLPGAAITTIATAVIQFGMFNPTFDFFQERLVPGTTSDYHPALVNPYWLGDVLLGAAQATMAAVWGWVAAVRSGRPRLRWLAGLLPAVVTVLHAVDPYRGGSTLAGLTVLAGAALWPQVRGRAARASLVLAALLPWLSTVGPLAGLLHSVQRFGPPAPVGLAAAVFQMLLGALGLAGLLRGLRPRPGAELNAALRRDARNFGLGAALLLLAGLAFGLQTGRDNRREIQQNRLRTTAAHAAVFDPTLLAPLVAPEFRIEWKSAGGESIPAHSAWLAGGAAEPARQRLEEVVRATPFLKVARILVLHDGWLVAALSSAGRAGGVEVLRRATPADLAHWTEKAPYVEESPVPEIGYDYYCRAPIVDASGRMLGWLDCVRSEYYLSVERRWRAAPFFITALGLVLLALVLVQRQSARERESALRAAAIFAEASRIKTTFLANVSHELRTPLQNILGYGELLQQNPLGEKNRARLEALLQQGELMTRLINDLIDLSAVEAGSFQLAVRPVAPGEVVRQTVESLRPRAEAKGLALRTETFGPVPAGVMVDDNRLRQVLLNLAGNAIKFTDRGTVTVSLRAESEPDGRSRLTLAVRDTGPGIPADQQARLFTAFSRLEKTAHKEGSGLGLALSAALCRAMDGSLAVESDGVSGACFTATFRVWPTPAPVEPRATVRVRPGFAPRVLVVDDNPLVRQLFHTSLTEHGAHCRPAATGAEALLRAAEENPDVIVLDLALPDGSGVDFVPRLRTLAPGVRIIGVSAHAAAPDRDRALAAGMDAFMVKPVPLGELWDAVAGAATAGSVPSRAFDPPEALRERLHREFLAELPVKRAELAAAVQSGDWPRVRSIAHYLRNSALVVQATALFEACTGLETAAVTGQVDSIRRWARRSEAVCAALLSASPTPSSDQVASGAPHAIEPGRPI